MKTISNAECADLGWWTLDRNPIFTPLDGVKGQYYANVYATGCLVNYRKSILLLRVSVLGRLRDLQYIFAVINGTLSI